MLSAHCVQVMLCSKLHCPYTQGAYSLFLKYKLKSELTVPDYTTNASILLQHVMKNNNLTNVKSVLWH